MQGITIQDCDERNVLEVDLKDILHLLGEAGIGSCWRMSNVSALGNASADELHRLSDSNATLGGQNLIKLADEVWQVTEGQFEAFRDGNDSAWCVIRAVDSSAYDVETRDDSILNTLRLKHKNV